MTEDPEIFVEVEAYCDAVGIKPSTLALRALGNGRFFDRLKRRRADDEDRFCRLRAYMAENPAHESEGAAA